MVPLLTSLSVPAALLSSLLTSLSSSLRLPLAPRGRPGCYRGVTGVLVAVGVDITPVCPHLMLLFACFECASLLVYDAGPAGECVCLCCEHAGLPYSNTITVTL
jgi:hypothetical protein